MIHTEKKGSAVVAISNNKRTITLGTVSVVIMYLYVFSGYIAQDILISSRFTSIFLYTFIGLSFLKALFELKKIGKISPFILWYGIFAIFSLIIMLYSPSVSFFSGTFYSIFVAFVLLYSFNLYIRTEKDFRKLAWCYTISGAATVLMLLATGNLHGNAGDRLGQDTFGNANIFASLMMIAAMYTLWLAVYTKGWKKWILILFFFADMYALALSSGRKYFIIPLIFLYFLLLFKQDKKGKTHFIRATIFAAVLIAAFWFAIMKIPLFYNAIGMRMESLLDAMAGTGGDNSALSREQMREAAISEWLKSPLWGYGLDSFKYFARDNFGHFHYSHCNYAELLYSGGILYFIFYYSIFFAILVKAIKKKDLSAPYRAFAIAVPISLFVFDYGAVSFSSAHNLILLLLAYKVLSFGNGEPKNVKTQNSAKSY